MIVHGRAVRVGLLGSEDDRRVRVDLLRRPCRARDPIERERLREAVRCPEAERGPTEAVVSDVGRHALAGTAATVEIVDTGADENRPPAGVVATIQVQRLVVTLAQGQVVAGLIAGAVDTAGLEEQRPELVAGDHVDEPGRRITPDLPHRSVGSGGLRVVGAPLIRDRRVQAERTHAPPSVETDRVALLVHRRVAGGSAPEAGGGGRGGAERDPAERAGAFSRSACFPTVGTLRRRGIANNALEWKQRNRGCWSR